MASGWTLLRQLASNQTHPTLLLKYEFATSSYKIWLTDLTNIWVEEMKQRPLIQRAWDIESDIDPIESDQRQMLLRHVQDSLDEKSGTNLALSYDEASNELLMTAYSPLPKPLRPLKWPIHLQISSQSSLTNELLLPLLAERLLDRDHISSLLSSLNHKDHVITKLTHRMQNEGIELGKVFPSAMSSKSSRKASSRDEVGKVVQGLAVYDERQWSNAMDVEKEKSQQSPHFIKSENQPLTKQADLPAPSHEHQSSSEKNLLPKAGSSLLELPQGTTDGDSTTDTSDDDLDLAQTKLKGPESIKAAENPGSPSESTSPEPPAEPQKTTLLKSMPLLGKIGAISKPTISPTKPKLGQIGGVGTTSKGPSDARSEANAQTRKHTKSPSLPRETSPERADRKREQLKRELGEKSKAVKKKRKF
ncbi:MAG: hypothetical protein Q9168_000450 [Polycauliona sp. 1 TL-2023]